MTEENQTEARVCEICDQPFAFHWTLVHGVGACQTCGSTYRIYHYDENDKPVDKPPTSTFTEDFKPVAKEFWQEKELAVPYGHYMRHDYHPPAENYAVLTKWLEEKHPEFLREK